MMYLRGFVGLLVIPETKQNKSLVKVQCCVVVLARIVCNS